MYTWPLACLVDSVYSAIYKDRVVEWYATTGFEKLKILPWLEFDLIVVKDVSIHHYFMGFVNK